MAEVLTVDEADAQEFLFERGWTDGLPVVPPTPQRVAAMLEAGGVEAPEVLGMVAERSRSVSAEQAAICAVMAGCPTNCFPIVLAAIDALLDPAFNPHGVLASTGGAATAIVVSGPIAREVGMNSGHNVLGPCNRPNATIGRAIRLLAITVFDARPGEMDSSSIGHPGKYTLCFAEDGPPAPWEPLRVSLGFDARDTTVTLMPVEGPRQIANHLNGDGRGTLKTIAAMMRNPRPSSSERVVRGSSCSARSTCWPCSRAASAGPSGRASSRARAGSHPRRWQTPASSSRPAPSMT